MKKLTRLELIKLLKKIAEADFESEAEYDTALELFLSHVPDPEASRLIFNVKPELTPEEIVDKALAYKPIVLPPRDDKL